MRSPAGIALLSQRLLRGPQVALAPRRRLGGGLGAAAGLVTVLVAHGLDVAAAAHSPAWDGALACGVRLARGQQRGGPFATASGHLGLGGQPSARVAQGAAHTPSAPPATQPRAHHLGSELHARTPISRPLKLPRCPPGEFGLRCGVLPLKAPTSRAEPGLGRIPGSQSQFCRSFPVWPSPASDLRGSQAERAPAKPSRQNAHNGFHCSYPSEQPLCSHHFPCYLSG